MQALTDPEALRGHIDTMYSAIQVPGLTRRVFETSFGEGRILVEYVVSPALANRAGFVQGGACAVMLESCMSMVGAVKSGGLLSTPMVDFKVSLMRPVTVWVLTVRAQVVRMGRTLAFMEASLMDSDGKVLARASGTGMPKPVSASQEEQT